MIKGTPDRLFARTEPQRPPFSNPAIMTSTPISFCRLCQKYRLDPEAFAASHIFSTLETKNIVSMADISDLKMLHDMGYKNFMFSDDVSHRCFDDAVRSWQDFKKVYDAKRGYAK